MNGTNCGANPHDSVNDRGSYPADDPAAGEGPELALYRPLAQVFGRSDLGRESST